MRDYSKVSSQFWIGATGKKLRGNVEAQIVAMYLMTAPNSEMTGVFYCPLWTIAAETGLGEEGASKGLRRLVELDFCIYEADSEVVFVHEMAKYQIGEELKINDNQVKSVHKAFSAMKGVIKKSFFEKYEHAFHLENTSPSKAPPKPRAGTGTGTGDIPAAPKQSKKTSLPNGFGISERVRTWAAENKHSKLEAHLENFISAAKRKAYTYADWDEAFMEAIRKDWAKLGAPAANDGAKRFAGAK